MKTNRTMLWWAACLLAALCAVRASDYQRARLARAALAAEDAGPVEEAREHYLEVVAECGSAGCSITPSAEQIMAYLKVTPEETLSLRVTAIERFCHLDAYVGSFDSAQVDGCHIYGPGSAPHVVNCIGYGDAPAGIQAKWAFNEVQVYKCTSEIEDGIENIHYFVHEKGLTPDTVEHEITMELRNVELRVERTSPYAPTGEGVRGARKPEDHALSYQWCVREDTLIYIKVTGAYNAAGEPFDVEVTGRPSNWVNGEPVGLGIGILGRLHDGQANTTYLEIDANCDGYPILYDGWDVPFYGDRARAWGAGNRASWGMVQAYAPGSGSASAQASVSAWHAVDLSHLAVYTAERGKIEELLDACLVSIFGYTATVAQWRALGVAIIQNSSWLGWQSNMDGVFDGTCAGPLCAPEVDATWAEEHGHNPGDVRIHVDAGGLDWACQGSPYRKLLTVNHLTDLEVFNPSLAATCPATATLPTGITGAWATSHAEFPGLGAGWQFEVGEAPESRQITIALRSNMEDRIEQAKLGPLFSPPAGYDPTWTPPPIPECHRIRAAGGWQPTKEPPESRCDWDNFAWLRAVLACSGAWTAEDCTFEVGYYTPTVTDNFKSGDDRRTGGEDGDPYDVDWGSLQWLEFEVVAPSDGEDGNRYIDLLFPVSWEEGGSGGQVVPDLRFVRAVRVTLPAGVEGEDVFLGAHLSGPVASGWASDTAAGAHVLALHPTVPEETEGTDSHGPDFGWSIVTDGKPGARTVQLWKRRTEEGIPYYYYVVGAVSGYDLGTGASWQQAAAELNKQEGFNCAENTAAYENMCYEEGDTGQGKLWEPQAYDAREGHEDTGRLHYGADGAVEVWFAQRVRSVYPPPLRVYHLYALKHLAGGVWGTAKRKTLPEPDPEHGHVRERTWQQDPYGYYGYGSGGGSEEWALLGSAYPSGASPLVLWPIVTGQQFTTGIGVTATTVETLGVIPCREFYWWSPLASAGGGGVFLAQDIAGIVWRVTTNEAGLLRAHWFEPHRADPEWHEADAHPFGDDEGFERPSVYCDLDGSLLVAATLDGDTVIARSRTCGADWEEVTMPHIGSGIAYGTLGGHFSGVALCGNDGTDVLLRLSSREDLAAEDLATGVDELVVCAAPDAEALTAVLHLGGEIIVAVQSGDDTLTYRARDFAEDGFEEVVA